LADLSEDGSRRQIGKTNGGRLGLVVTALTDDELARLDIEGGVRVVDVGEVATEAGIRPGDIVTRLNHQSISSPGAFTEIEDSLKAGRTVPVLVLRNQRPVFLALRVPE